MKKLLILSIATPLLVMAADQAQTKAVVPTPTMKTPTTKIDPSTKIADLTVAQLQDLVKETVHTELRNQIRVVDPMKTVQGDPYWLDKAADLQKEQDRRTKDIERVAMERQRKGEDLKTKATVLKRDAIENMELELARLDNEIKVKQQQAQRDLQEMYEMSQMEIYKHISEITKEISEKEGVCLVQAGGLIFADPVVDMSEQVIELSKQKYNQEKKDKETKTLALAKNNTAAKPETKKS